MRAPRSIRGKRELANDAWEKWQNGEINGKERDDKSKPYLSVGAIDVGTPADVDAIREARKEASKAAAAEKRSNAAKERHEAESRALLRQARRQSGNRQLNTQAKAEKEAQAAAKFEARVHAAKQREYDSLNATSKLREAVREREQNIAQRLAPGELKIIKEMEATVASGKRTQEQRDASIQRWKDASEKTIRNSAKIKEDKIVALAKKGFKEDTDREPGIKWKGGQLRSGSMAGEVMPIAQAVSFFADKYAKSTMPDVDITPNVHIRGIGPLGEQVTVKVPQEFIEDLKNQANDNPGKTPNASKLIQWASEWCAENGVDEIDMYADDADEFDT